MVPITQINICRSTTYEEYHDYIKSYTAFTATPEQIEAGVVEPRVKDIVQHYLTFDELPTQEVINLRVSRLVGICRCWKSHKLEALQHATQQSDSIPYTLMEVHQIMRPDVMIGGAPFLMEPLAKALRQAGFNPVYAFSTRESTETTINGEVIKTSKFIHQGFVGI